MVAVFDLIDNALKGGAYLDRFGPTYYLQAPIGITACLIACYTANRKVHLSIIAVHFAHQLYLISRYFNG